MEPDEYEGMYSARNIIRIIGYGIDEIKNFSSIHTGFTINNNNNIDQFTQYLKSFQIQYLKYHHRLQQQKQQENQQSNKLISQDIKLKNVIKEIPMIFFAPFHEFKLSITDKRTAKTKQYQYTQFLDDIDMIIFIKTSKWPNKSLNLINYLTQTAQNIKKSFYSIARCRQKLKNRIKFVSDQQLQISKCQRKQQNLKKVLYYMQLCRKVRQMKISAESKQFSEQELIYTIKRNELSLCGKLSSLRQIISNIEEYREKIKNRLYDKFTQQIDKLIKAVLYYDPTQWKQNLVPNNGVISNLTKEQSANNFNQSNLSITILDQTYFAFEQQFSSASSEIALKKENDSPLSSLNKNQQIQQVTRLWQLIIKFDLYEENQINQLLMRYLIRHNVMFNHHMNQYLGELIKTQNLLPQKSSQDSLSIIDMKIYMKIVKFYYDLLRKFIRICREYCHLEFLRNFIPKIYNFIQQRVKYFLKCKKITYSTTFQDFLIYLQLIEYWINNNQIEIYQLLQTSKKSLIEQHLTNIQKNILVNELKNQIEKCNYEAIRINSDMYMSFHYILNWKNNLNQQPQIQSHLDMSMSILGNINNNEQNTRIRIIDKQVILDGNNYCICSTFITIIKQIYNYLNFKTLLIQYQNNIDQKICQIVGFYVWYNQKVLTGSKNGEKSLSNLCVFFNSLQLLKQIFNSLNISNKKATKTKSQFIQCEVQLTKAITMAPFMMIQMQISTLYEHQIITQSQVPTISSIKMIQIIKNVVEQLKKYFKIERVIKILTPCMKMLYKNYFRYLTSIEKRGLTELKWFLPKLKDIMLQPGSLQIYLFHDEINQMQKLLKNQSTKR